MDLAYNMTSLSTGAGRNHDEWAYILVSGVLLADTKMIVSSDCALGRVSRTKQGN